MWAVMCVCHHVCRTQARSCLSTGWALNRCFAWFFGTAAVLAQGGGRGMWKALEKGYLEHPGSACCSDGMLEIFVLFGRCCLLPAFVNRQSPCPGINSRHVLLHPQMHRRTVGSQKSTL